MISPSKALLTTISLLLVASFAITGVISVPNTNVLSVLCNSGVFTGGDPFAISLAYVLSDLQAVTPARKGHDYYNISPFPNAFAYGHAACTANLTAGDCTTCLTAAVGAVNNTCFMRIGARSVLSDCVVRYEQYPFVNLSI